MKKIISLILTFTLFFSIFNISVYAVENTTNEEDVEDFCEELTEMVNDYADSEFVTPDSSVIEETTAELGEETEINFCSRLIVQSDNRINTYNAIDVVSGFSNFYILQFENEKDTNYAYEQYKADENIISVSYDVSYNAFNAVTEDSNEEVASLTYEDYKNAWYVNSTGINLAIDKCKNKNSQEIVVGVIDTGIDLNSAYLQERIVRTYFNSSGENKETSEQDYYGHGTMVSSVIMNCTPSNVKIANYRCGTKSGQLATTAATSAILKAIEDGVKIINCSFGLTTGRTLLEEVIDYAYTNNCYIIVAAGNNTGNISVLNGDALTNSNKTITVGANNNSHTPSGWTGYGEPIDVLAPGENITVISFNDEVLEVSGTSLSAPFLGGLLAMHILLYPQYSFQERMRIMKNSGEGTREKYVENYFGSGIINILELFKLDTLQKPIFNIIKENNIGKVLLEIYAEDDTDIYYTTDYTYPSPTNGTLYTKPIEIYDDTVMVTAVSYKNNLRSNYASQKIRSFVLGTNDMFEVNEEGVITNYSGNVKYLKIPEKINGITIKDISFFSGFDTAELLGVILPDTVEYLGWTLDAYQRAISGEEQIGAFDSNKTLQFIGGKGIKVIGYYGVANLSNLYEVDFPNCELIMYEAFYQSSLFGVEFPKVKKIENRAFYYCQGLREIYLPECQYIGYSAFEHTQLLTKIFAPNADYSNDTIFENEFPKEDETGERIFYFNERLKKINFSNLKTIGIDFFEKSAIKTVELSTIENMYDLPSTMHETNPNSIAFGSVYNPYYLPIPIELVLPSTLKYCVSAEEYKYPEYNSFCVYGTKGTYAEEWAKENEIEFIEITQETSIREDIEPIWDEWSYNPLEFDARGFNRTYQWYGYNKSKENAVAIKGATDKTFNPEDYKQYQYYYCEMTSVDGNSVVTVTSGTCHNKMYNMFAIKDTYIDYDNNLIYTQQTLQKNFDNILKIQDDTSYYVVPSYVYKKNSYYGTGSQFLIYSGGVYKETFTLIVQGDVNGDSVIDVMDCMLLELARNNLTTLDGAYFTAGDLAENGVIDSDDYNGIVNKAIA